MLQIYCGNGKGKTTAAVGAAVRAAGAGMRTAFFQFLKNGSSSEISSMESIGIRTSACPECCKFSWEMNESELGAVRDRHNSLLAEAARFIAEEHAGMIVLDEFLDAYKAGLFDTAAAERFVLSGCKDCEIILTGREALSPFAESADYISEISAVKHPYENGTPARKGIEY